MSSIDTLKAESLLAADIIGELFEAHDTRSRYGRTGCDEHAREFVDAIVRLDNLTRGWSGAAKHELDFATGAEQVVRIGNRPPMASAHIAVFWLALDVVGGIADWVALSEDNREPEYDIPHVCPPLPSGDAVLHQLAAAVEAFDGSCVTIDELNMLSALRERELARAVSQIGPVPKPSADQTCSAEAWTEPLTKAELAKYFSVGRNNTAPILARYRHEVVAGKYRLRIADMPPKYLEKRAIAPPLN